MISDKRKAVIQKYEEILGRNKYSQSKRSYAFKKHSDGKYYSDCSSSIALAYKYAGYPFYDNNGSYNPNTVGMYTAKSLVEVPVEIKNGVIQNPEILELCDMLLFAGSDTSRKYAGYVGHVEMVGKISNGKVTLYGHGSGTPRATEMNAYCKSRYKQKTKTNLGHKGLIKVVRFFNDVDEPTKVVDEGKQIIVTGNSVNIRSGPGTEYAIVHTANKGDKFPAVDPENWNPVKHDDRVCWISGNYSKTNK